MYYTKTNKGQVAIIVLLLTAIALSFGLSTARQSVVDTRIETDTKDLKDAFSAAESAIEQYWSTDGSVTKYSNGIGASGIVTSANIGSVTSGSNKFLEYSDFVTTGARAIFWLMDHDVDGNLDPLSVTNYSGVGTTMCFDSGYVGGLQAEILYKDGNTYTIERVGYNVGQASGTTYGVSGFTNLDGTTTPAVSTCGSGAGAISGKNGVAVDFSFMPILPGSSKPVLIAIRPMTSDPASSNNRGTKLILASSQDFPSQGIAYTAVGNKGVSQRALRVDDRWVLPLGLELWMDGATSGDSIEGN